MRAVTCRWVALFSVFVTCFLSSFHVFLLDSRLSRLPGFLHRDGSAGGGGPHGRDAPSSLAAPRRPPASSASSVGDWDGHPTLPAAFLEEGDAEQERAAEHRLAELFHQVYPLLDECTGAPYRGSAGRRGLETPSPLADLHTASNHPQGAGGRAKAPCLAPALCASESPRAPVTPPSPWSPNQDAGSASAAALSDAAPLPPLAHIRGRRRHYRLFFIQPLTYYYGMMDRWVTQMASALMEDAARRRLEQQASGEPAVAETDARESAFSTTDISYDVYIWGEGFPGFPAARPPFPSFCSRAAARCGREGSPGGFASCASHNRLFRALFFPSCAAFSSPSPGAASFGRALSRRFGPQTPNDIFLLHWTHLTRFSDAEGRFRNYDAQFWRAGLHPSSLIVLIEHEWEDDAHRRLLAVQPNLVLHTYSQLLAFGPASKTLVSLGALAGGETGVLRPPRGSHPGDAAETPSPTGLQRVETSTPAGAGDGADANAATRASARRPSRWPLAANAPRVARSARDAFFSALGEWISNAYRPPPTTRVYFSQRFRAQAAEKPQAPAAELLEALLPHGISAACILRGVAPSPLAPGLPAAGAASRRAEATGGGGERGAPGDEEPLASAQDAAGAKAANAAAREAERQSRRAFVEARVETLLRSPRPIDLLTAGNASCSMYPTRDLFSVLFRELAKSQKTAEPETQKLPTGERTESGGDSSTQTATADAPLQGAEGGGGGRAPQGPETRSPRRLTVHQVRHGGYTEAKTHTTISREFPQNFDQLERRFALCEEDARRSRGSQRGDAEECSQVRVTSAEGSEGNRLEEEEEAGRDSGGGATAWASGEQSVKGSRPFTSSHLSAFTKQLNQHRGAYLGSMMQAKICLYGSAEGWVLRKAIEMLASGCIVAEVLLGRRLEKRRKNERTPARGGEPPSGARETEGRENDGEAVAGRRETKPMESAEEERHREARAKRSGEAPPQRLRDDAERRHARQSRFGSREDARFPGDARDFIIPIKIDLEAILRRDETRGKRQAAEERLILAIRQATDAEERRQGAHSEEGEGDRHEEDDDAFIGLRHHENWDIYRALCDLGDETKRLIAEEMRTQLARLVDCVETGELDALRRQAMLFALLQRDYAQVFRDYFFPAVEAYRRGVRGRLLREGDEAGGLGCGAPSPFSSSGACRGLHSSSERFGELADGAPAWRYRSLYRTLLKTLPEKYLLEPVLRVLRAIVPWRLLRWR
ncbi:hypothetical protein BESB_015170 [Besnoitia besnoiti]|uniref:Uncharacterized protein n=1 Tax=Besnoitia besnoiti TaxID=94643 RepID=A0A2A9M6U3_BESBE|nr:hypothetical protein BESB_015170 [Besnoitia besnoiti]PFH32904.1 hypothetical protein BESB_015170 [Besnoitia besnoiti]